MSDSKTYETLAECLRAENPETHPACHAAADLIQSLTLENESRKESLQVIADNIESAKCCNPNKELNAILDVMIVAVLDSGIFDEKIKSLSKPEDSQ